MDVARYQRVCEICEVALDLTGTDRTQWLDQACAGDNDLRDEVDAILRLDSAGAERGLPLRDTQVEAARKQLDALIDGHAPTSEQAPSHAHSEGIAALPANTTIGKFTIDRMIGAGGMGAVYAATQARPNRSVALKLIRPGYATQRMLRRFEVEAEFLGRLHHPGIAQVHDAGVAETPHGQQPYFAMELVDGVPLTDYADAHDLGTRKRLGLIAKIADAVEHAHQRGVIHRDLKPGNILVTKDGQPKVLDFGVARATDSDLQTTTLQTDVGALIGTLAYMSPEQASGDPNELDTRSDVYSLGVIAYELLAGRMPYDISKRMIHEAARVIREEDPTSLSTLNRTLRGDVETIIGKALEKEKSRRYQSAADFADDIRRYLDHKPITARPPSTIYQLKKFSRRNKALVAGVAATFVVLIAGIMATSWQAVVATRAERRASIEADKATRTADFATAMLQGVTPDIARGKDTTLLQELLDEAAERIDAELGNEPEIEAVMRTVIGDSYRSIAEYDAARLHLERAHSLYQEHFGADHPQTLTLLGRLGTLQNTTGHEREGLEIIRKVYEASVRIKGENHPDTIAQLANIGGILRQLQEFDEAEACLRKALAQARQHLSPDNRGLANALFNLAALLNDMGEYDEAEALCRENVDWHDRIDGRDHPDTLSSVATLAVILYANNKQEEAIPCFEDALEMRIRIMGPEHSDTVRSYYNLGAVYMARDRYDDARPLMEKSFEVQRKVKGEDHPHTLYVAGGLSTLYVKLGELDQAEVLARNALETARATMNEGDPRIATLAGKHGYALTALGRYAQAETLLLEGYKVYAEATGDAHIRTQHIIGYLADLYEQWDRAEPGRGYGAKSAQWRAKVLDNDS